MKKKNSFIIWLLSIIFISFLMIASIYLYFNGIIDISAFLPILLAVIDLLVTIIGGYSFFRYPYINNHLYDYDLDSFVDRNSEMKKIFNQLNSGDRLIYISGQNGIGKTWLLNMLNKKIYEKDGVYLRKATSIYIDIQNGADIRKSLLTIIKSNEDLNNIDLLKRLHKITKSKNIVILLDNASDSVFLDVEEWIRTLLSLDGNIIFVIATVSKKQEAINMSKFSDKEIKQLASLENISIDDNDYDTILSVSNGLPIMISLLVRHYKPGDDFHCISEAHTYIEKIYKSLNDDLRLLAVNLAYASLSTSAISLFQFRKFFPKCTKDNLKALINNGLVEYSNNSNQIKVPDFFAQVIREITSDLRYDICQQLYCYICNTTNNLKDKLIYLLLSNCLYMAFEELEQHFVELLQDREYNYFVYLFEMLEDFHLLNPVYDVRDIRVDLYYCYIHSFLELGEYQKAREYLEDSEKWNTDVNLRKINSSLSFEFNFDLADMEHFFGEFEHAIESYQIIQRYSITDAQKLKCQWAIGHCYRHLGDLASMNIALNCFESIISQGSHTAYYIRSYQSIILIKLFLQDKNYDYKEAFSRMIESIDDSNIKGKAEILTSRQYALYHRIILGNNIEALKILQGAVDSLKKTGIRIIYDYYFEIAETIRHIIVCSKEKDGTMLNQCFEYYNKALEFAVRSGDKSLENVVHIGLILTRIYLGQSISDDLRLIIEICDFSERKHITYILNYAYMLKDYLLNAEYVNSSPERFDALMNMNIFIM